MTEPFPPEPVAPVPGPDMPQPVLLPDRAVIKE